MTTTPHQLSGPLRLAVALRSLAGHQGAEIGLGHIEGDGQGGEAGSGRQMGAIRPVSECVGCNPKSGGCFGLGPVTFPTDNQISQICVFHGSRNTHFCESSRGEFADLRNVLGCRCLDFGAYLEAAINAAKLQKNTFAERVSTSPSVVTDTVKGRRRPPLDRLNDWADSLGLTELERRQFKLLAGLAHIPDESVREFIADEIEGMRQALEVQQAKLLELQKTVKKLKG